MKKFPAGITQDILKESGLWYTLGDFAIPRSDWRYLELPYEGKRSLRQAVTGIYLQGDMFYEYNNLNDDRRSAAG